MKKLSFMVLTCALLGISQGVPAQHTSTKPRPSRNPAPRKSTSTSSQKPVIVDMNVEEVLQDVKPGPSSRRPTLTNDDFASGTPREENSPTDPQPNQPVSGSVGGPVYIFIPPQSVGKTTLTRDQKLAWYRQQAKTLQTSIRSLETDIAKSEDQLRKMKDHTIVVDQKYSPRTTPIPRTDPRYVHNGYFVETPEGQLEQAIEIKKRRLASLTENWYSLMDAARKDGFTEHQVVD